jgi:FkbM family methyltransferase
MPAEHDIDIVVKNAFFAESKPGVFVEVGAARPDYLSISESFRKQGWKIIAIEPNPEFCAAHRAQGHEVLQYACSDVDADDVPFYVVNSKEADYMGGKVSYESFSSLGIRDDFAELHKTVSTDTNMISVQVRRLDTILAMHEPELTTFDMLAVDVEGWELSVLRGLSIARFRPKVVILENLFKDTAYEKAMREREYRLWRTLEPNEIYVSAACLMSPAERNPGGWRIFSRLFQSRL